MKNKLFTIFSTLLLCLIGCEEPDPTAPKFKPPEFVGNGSIYLFQVDEFDGRLNEFLENNKDFRLSHYRLVGSRRTSDQHYLVIVHYIDGTVATTRPVKPEGMEFLPK